MRSTRVHFRLNDQGFVRYSSQSQPEAVWPTASSVLPSS